MTIAVVVGNPRAGSRTLAAALGVAGRLSDDAPSPVVDLVTLGPGLVDWGDPAVAGAVEAVRGADAVVVASPTFKGTYTGILKCFLDQIPTGGLRGVVAFPLMLGASWNHALAPELTLRPVLTELGAACPARGLYMVDSDYEDPEGLSEWVDSARRWVGPRR